MALTGTLRDVAIVSLLQFPNTGKRSGHIAVNSNGRKASFYYDAGNLVHAVLGSVSGEEVLVEVVDWTDGDFTFDPGVEPPEVTIEKDLHRCIMWALKERDERKKLSEEQAPLPGQVPRSQELEKLVSESGSFVYASLIEAGGDVICSSSLPGETGETITDLQKAVSAMLATYPGSIPRRLIVDDERFSMICEAITEDRVMMAVAEPGTRMGILPIAAAKLVEALKKNG
jgi:hypothetical protein